jgi:osmotically-inducible protein OsmY
MNRIVSFLFILLLGGCAIEGRKTPEAKPAFRAMGESVTVEQPQNAEVSRSDEAIGYEVRRQINLVGASVAVGITVEVSDGVVTLRGSAPSPAASWRAQGAAQAVKGVRQVVNQIVTPNFGPTY